MGVEVLELTTSEPDVGFQALNDVFITDGPAARFRSVRPGFQLRMRSMTADELCADTVQLTAVAEGAAHPMSYFHVGTMLGGEMRFCAGSEDVRIRRGSVVRYPNDTSMWAEWRHVHLVFVRAPMAAINLVAKARGARPDADVQFQSVQPVSADAARQWRLTSEFVHHTLSASSSFLDNALVRAEFTALVAATALTVFPNTTMTMQYVPEVAPALPAVLRRAVAFIDEHATEPLTVIEIAAAARVTPRALQLAFRRHYDTTPMGYVRRVRLDGVHRDLRAADPTAGATVTEIAARWGFRHSATFARQYRARFGAMPRQTLWS